MKIIVVFLSCILFLLQTGCCYPVRYDGPYKGRVVDAETGRPLEGVVVLGVWYKQVASPAGGVSSYYDAKETVTDKKGEFEIKGKGLKIFSTVAPLDVLIFKAGYEYIGMGPWDSFKEDEILRNKIKWKGKMATIPINRVTKGEREMDPLYPPIPPTEAPLNSVRLILEEINKDLTKYGFEPMTIWGGEHL